MVETLSAPQVKILLTVPVVTNLPVSVLQDKMILTVLPVKPVVNPEVTVHLLNLVVNLVVTAHLLNPVTNLPVSVLPGQDDSYGSSGQTGGQSGNYGSSGNQSSGGASFGDKLRGKAEETFGKMKNDDNLAQQ